MHGWRSKSTDGPKGGWSCAFWSGCSVGKWNSEKKRICFKYVFCFFKKILIFIGGMRRTEDGRWRTKGARWTENGGRRWLRERKTEDEGWRTEDEGWRTEDEGWRIKDGWLRMNDGKSRTENGTWTCNWYLNFGCEIFGLQVLEKVQFQKTLELRFETTRSRWEWPLFCFFCVRLWIVVLILRIFALEFALKTLICAEKMQTWF